MKNEEQQILSLLGHFMFNKVFPYTLFGVHTQGTTSCRFLCNVYGT